MARMKRKKYVAPFYAACISWVLCATMMPMYKLGGLIAAASVTFCVVLLTKAICVQRAKKAAPPEPEVVEPVGQYSSEVQAIINEGRLARSEMGRLYNSISNPEIKNKIREIMMIMEKIVEDAKHDESDVPQIRRFLNYYPPTTIKLLNAYDRMSDQGIDGENITSTMNRIESMLDTTIVAYKKQLDSLFANQALDIETDISVMNAMLAREGLSGGRDFDIRKDK